MRKGLTSIGHQTEDIHTVIFGNFIGKVGQLDSWTSWTPPCFFRLKYYYHWLSISYNNYYFKYVPVQLVQLSNLSNFRIVFSLQTLSFIGAILGYINMCYIYYVLYIMLIYGLKLRNLWLCYGNCSWSHWEYEYISYIRCYKLLSHQAHNT